MTFREDRQKLSLNLKNPNMRVATLLNIARRYAKQFNMDDKRIVEDLSNSNDIETLIQKFDGYFKDYIELKR